MFCSSSCLESGWSKFHKFECSTLDQSVDDDEYDGLIVKAVFESLNICGSLDELQALVADTKPSVTVFDFDLSLNADSRSKSLLKSTLSLTKCESSSEDLMMAEYIVESHPSMIAMCLDETQKDFLRDFMLQLMGIIDRNCYIFYYTSLCSSYVKDEVGYGVFAFASLFNHSCSPNLYRTFVDNKQVFVVRKPIESGEQLFVGYQ